MGDLIHHHQAWRRIGTDKERPHDRRYVYIIEMESWRKRWAKAEEENDFDAMKWLSSEHGQLECL